MDLRQLQMLLAVVETGSYAKAGERLWITHSAIHRQIRLLEEEVRGRILIKNGPRMEITDTGRILVELARTLNREVLEAERKLSSRHEKLSGSFRIGTGTTTLSFFLPPVLTQFRAEHPGVHLYILTGPGKRVAEEVRMRNLDIAFLMGGQEISTSERTLLWHRLYEDEFVVAISKEHPLAHDNVGGEIRLEQLAGCTFIMHSCASHVRRIIDRLCESAGLVPRVGMELENEETMELMVAINMGIAFLSKKRRKPHEDIMYLNVTDHTIKTEVAVVYGDDEYHPPIFREFLRLCHAHALRLQCAEAQHT